MSHPANAMQKIVATMIQTQMRPQDLFRAMDMDHDRGVSEEEVTAGLHRLGCTGELALTEKDIKGLVTALDKDGDGLLDMAEWKAGVSSSYHDAHRQQREERQKKLTAQQNQQQQEGGDGGGDGGGEGGGSGGASAAEEKEGA